MRSVIPKFVRKDINLVDFPKAAWVLNDAYRKMHNDKTPQQEGNEKSTQQTPKQNKQSSKLDDAYERKPSPINLKPLSPR